MDEKYRWWLPPDISTHGAGIDRLINVIHIFMVLLFVGWGIYLLYCLIRFRAKPGHKADTRHHHFRLPQYIEIGIAIFEVILLVFVSYPIWAAYKKDFPPEKDALVVRVTAEQFAWNIHYPGPDGKFGKTSPELIDGTNPVGLDRNDPDAKDDIISVNVFNIPVHKPVIVHLTSKDVIHSFSLPSMRVKQDVIPGMNIPIWFEATETGEFDIACAQLCGIGHYRMRGMFNVQTPEAYAQWIAEQEKELMPAAPEATPTAPPAGSQSQQDKGSSHE
jgi:cytochrome c oxidase subunit II